MQMILEGSVDLLETIMLMSIPIVAMVGGFTALIVKIVGRQRLQERAYRERIAALQRGMTSPVR
jgi:hypothetical protein